MVLIGEGAPFGLLALLTAIIVGIVRTAHYVTFEFDDGSRERFSVRGDQYGLLAEGDAGTLQSQGTRFKGFDREY